MDSDINIRKGESVFIDFPIETEDGTVATIPGTMSATYKVIDSTKAVVDNGTLAKDAGNTQFELRIIDTVTAGLDAATFTLEVLVDDTANGYADYIMESNLIIAE